MGLFPYKLGEKLFKGPENDNSNLVAIKWGVLEAEICQTSVRDMLVMVKSSSRNNSKNRIKMMRYPCGISW